MSTWVPALRIARRMVRRNLGRSLLVAVLVGIPVAGATLVDGIFRTFEDPQRRVERTMGGADAIVEVTNRTALPSDWRPRPWEGSGGPETGRERDPAKVDIGGLLPADSRITPSPTRFDLRFQSDDHSVRGNLVIGDVGDPLLDHAARLTSGRLPEGPDEVLVSRSLAERLDLLDDGQLQPGSQVTLRDGLGVAVTGLAINPFCVNCDQMMALPGSDTHALVAEDATGWTKGATDTSSVAYLVDLPEGVDAFDLWPSLAEQGIALTPREVRLNPDQYSGVGNSPVTVETLQMIALTALIVGLGLLEVILLAGAAFAVGARRQTRDLGLVSANGGTARHVRRIVLAQGVVLGALGALLGVTFGAGLALAGEPLWERLSNELIDGWRFGPLEIAIAAGVGLLSGLAAAIVPAVGAARMRPVDALAGRFRATKLTTRMPALGLALLGLGLGIAFTGNRLIAANFAEYSRRLEEAAGTGAWVESPSTAGPVTLQLGGAAIAIAGLVITIPGLVSMLAKLGRRLPLSARYAVRDAARHRHRTAPAVSAIMIVVAGSVGVAFAITGTERARELQYTPGLPDDVMHVSSEATLDDLAEAQSTDLISDATAEVAPLLPDPEIIDFPVVIARTEPSEHMPPDLPADASALYLEPPEMAPADCMDGPCVMPSGGQAIAVATPELYELSAGHDFDASIQQALGDGKVVMFDDTWVWPDGNVRVLDHATEEYAPVSLPVHVAHDRDLAYQVLPSAFVSAETAREQGWLTATTSAFLTYDDATDDQVDAALDAAELNAAWAQVEHEPGGITPIYLALVAGSAFVTLVGVAISVALAAAEGRADLATLAAVGAPPRRRRVLSGAQALVVGGLGTLLGVGLGTYIAFTAWPTTGAPEFLVPWQTLALTGIAVPVLAVVVAMLFTPSRLPMLRRLE